MKGRTQVKEGFWILETRIVYVCHSEGEWAYPLNRVWFQVICVKNYNAAGIFMLYSNGSQHFYSPIPLQTFNLQLRTPSSTRVSALSNVVYCHHCKPTTHTHYMIHLLNIRMSFCHNPTHGKWQRALIGPGHNNIIIINNFALYLTILHIKAYLLIEHCE
jgi:hypothetical protein